jgi:hypothetical protein
MTTEELKQDFESALVKHLHFKSRLRSFLYGNGLEEGPLRNPEQCSLGQWIASRIRGPYAHIPEARLLDQAHVRIHKEANRLMDLHQAGAVETAIAGFHVVQLIAEDITQLLRTIEDKLRTEA